MRDMHESMCLCYNKRLSCSKMNSPLQIVHREEEEGPHTFCTLISVLCEQTCIYVYVDHKSYLFNLH